MNDEAPEITPEQYQKLLIEAAANNWQCTVCGHNDLPLAPLNKGGFVCMICSSLLALPHEQFDALDKEFADNPDWSDARTSFTTYDPNLDWYRYIVSGEEVPWEHPECSRSRKALGEYVKQETQKEQAKEDAE